MGYKVKLTALSSHSKRNDFEREFNEFDLAKDCFCDALIAFANVSPPNDYDYGDSQNSFYRKYNHEEFKLEFTKNWKN